MFIEEITVKVEWIEDLGDKRIVGNNILASDNNSELKNFERFITEAFGSAISKVFLR